MINILSYVGLDLHTEVCLWTLIGLFSTLFDGTLFRVNDNLKLVWQMNMPEELSLAVQSLVRTMISGIILVQCFTVYVYLAAYVVLLYPLFLEDRPALVLPWLLLSAIRKLLCELTGLTIGLGICILLGASKPPCVRFLIMKMATIMPSFYFWILMLNYYHKLKLLTTFKAYVTEPMDGDNIDHGLELAVRRRRTKSLFSEEILRKSIVVNLYANRPTTSEDNRKTLIYDDSGEQEDTLTINENMGNFPESTSFVLPDADVIIPKGTDRVMEQFVRILMQVGIKEENDFNEEEPTSSQSISIQKVEQNIDLSEDDLNAPPQVASCRSTLASYITDYPQIFMKNQLEACSMTSDELLQTSNKQSVRNSLSESKKTTDDEVKINDKPKRRSSSKVNSETNDINHSFLHILIEELVKQSCKEKNANACTVISAISSEELRKSTKNNENINKQLNIDILDEKPKLDNENKEIFENTKKIVVENSIIDKSLVTGMRYEEGTNAANPSLEEQTTSKEIESPKSNENANPTTNHTLTVNKNDIKENKKNTVPQTRENCNKKTGIISSLAINKSKINDNIRENINLNPEEQIQTTSKVPIMNNALDKITRKTFHNEHIDKKTIENNKKQTESEKKRTLKINSNETCIHRESATNIEQKSSEIRENLLNNNNTPEKQIQKTSDVATYNNMPEEITKSAVQNDFINKINIGNNKKQSISQNNHTLKINSNEAGISSDIKRNMSQESNVANLRESPSNSIEQIQTNSKINNIISNDRTSLSSNDVRYENKKSSNQTQPQKMDFQVKSKETGINSDLTVNVSKESSKIKLKESLTNNIHSEEKSIGTDENIKCENRTISSIENISNISSMNSISDISSLFSL